VFTKELKKKNRLYKTLSDHFGLSVEIKLKDPNKCENYEDDKNNDDKIEDEILLISEEKQKLL